MDRYNKIYSIISTFFQGNGVCEKMSNGKIWSICQSPMSGKNNFCCCWHIDWMHNLAFKKIIGRNILEKNFNIGNFEINVLVAKQPSYVIWHDGRSNLTLARQSNLHLFVKKKVPSGSFRVLRNFFMMVNRVI